MVDDEIVLTFNPIWETAIDTLKSEFYPKNCLVGGDRIGRQLSTVLSLWIYKRIH
jgi:hypothetical protein